MIAPASPTVRRRRLAAELRGIRETKGKSGDAVAAALKWSPSKISRYERARTGLRPREVERLLDYYGITGSHRDLLLGLAEDAAQKGWWEEFADTLAEDYQQFIGLEHEAIAHGELADRDQARATQLGEDRCRDFWRQPEDYRAECVVEAHARTSPATRSRSNRPSCCSACSMRAAVVDFDVPAVLPLEGSLPVKWLDFTSEHSPAHLQANQHEPFYADLTIHQPTVYLNSSIPGYQNLLSDRKGRGPLDAALHNAERVGIARQKPQWC